MRDGVVHEEEEGADGGFEVGDGSVFFRAVGEVAGRVGEHHYGGHDGDHICGVVERAGRKLGRVAGDFADGGFAKLEELRVEGARLDGEEGSPLDSDIIFGGEAARGFLRFANHYGKDPPIKRALVHGDFADAWNSRDNAGLDFDDTGGAHDASAGLRMAASDFTALKRGGRSGEESIAAQMNWSGAGVCGLADEAEHVALQSESAEDDASRLVLRFEDAA